MKYCLSILDINILCLSFQVTDMMVANSHNLIVTVKPANQRNNVAHRGSKTSMENFGSVGSAGSTGSALSHDSPSPASQSNPITARYDMDWAEGLNKVLYQNFKNNFMGPGCKSRLNSSETILTLVCEDKYSHKQVEIGLIRSIITFM